MFDARIAHLSFPGISFSVCFSYGSESVFQETFVCVGNSAAREIRKEFPVFFMPEIAGVIYNFDSQGAREIVTVGDAYKIKELTVETACSTILTTLAPLFRGKTILTVSKKPESFYKTERDETVDPWNNACTTTLALLRKDNPELSRAIAETKPNAFRAKAFVADVVRRLGFGPVGFSTDDPQFVKMICEARQAFDNRAKRKTKVDVIDWHLAYPANWARYHMMDFDEVAEAVAEETQTPRLTEVAIRKRIQRLSLIPIGKRGVKRRKAIRTI